MNTTLRADTDEIKSNLNDIRDRMTDKRVLVTGGAGFLGSWLCEVLTFFGADVLCVDNLASGQESNISDLLHKDNFTFIKHDITRPLFFDKDLDVVLHLASRASPFEFLRFPIQILKANTLGIWVALGIAKRHNARLLYTSTSEIYGNATEIPTSEAYNGNVNPIGVRSCYDEAKRCGESFVMAYRLEHGIDARIARLFNTYGPKMRADDIYGRVVPRFIEQALKNSPITVFGDGSQTRRSNRAYVLAHGERCCVEQCPLSAAGEHFWDLFATLGRRKNLNRLKTRRDFCVSLPDTSGEAKTTVII